MSWLSSKMMKQQSPEQLQQLLMGGGVSGMLDQQQGLFGGMMQGQIPDAVRQQMMGAGADAATSAGNQMNRTLAMTGGGGSGQGRALQNILESQSQNKASEQMGAMIPGMMEQGAAGMQNVLGARQGVQSSMAGLQRANMADKNSLNQMGMGLLGGGLMNWLGGRAGGELDASGNPIQTRGMNLLGKAGELFGGGGAAGGGGISSLLSGLGTGAQSAYGAMGALGPIGLGIMGGKLLGEGMDKFMPGYRKGLNKVSTGMFGGRAKNLFTPWKWRLGGK